MHIRFRYATRLIAFCVVALAVSTPALASAIEQTGSFKLAMGPMSAAQKNQGQGTEANSEAVEIKPHHHAKPHHHIKHPRRHHER